MKRFNNGLDRSQTTRNRRVKGDEPGAPPSGPQSPGRHPRFANPVSWAGTVGSIPLLYAFHPRSPTRPVHGAAGARDGRGTTHLAPGSGPRSASSNTALS